MQAAAGRGLVIVKYLQFVLMRRHKHETGTCVNRYLAISGKSLSAGPCSVSRTDARSAEERRAQYLEFVQSDLARRFTQESAQKRFGQKGDPALGSCSPGGAAIDEIPPDIDQVVGTVFEQDRDQSRRLVTILRRLQLTAWILATLLRNDEFVQRATLGSWNLHGNSGSVENHRFLIMIEQKIEKPQELRMGAKGA